MVDNGDISEETAVLVVSNHDVLWCGRISVSAFYTCD